MYFKQDNPCNNNDDYSNKINNLYNDKDLENYEQQINFQNDDNNIDN